MALQYFSSSRCLSSLLIVLCLTSFSNAETLKSVNLGGWLVTEGWMTPSLFDGIPNKDFLDGTQVQFKSVTQGMYLSAENGGGTNIVANRPNASGWETFKLWRISESTFNFRVFGGQFMGHDNGGNLVAVAANPQAWETFEIVLDPNDNTRVRLKSSNGFFVQVKTATQLTADHPGDTTWGDDDPSVFLLTRFGSMQGEFQVTNGYGPQQAPSVMQNHWNTWIVEADFQFISQHGLGGVRIPVGWWIASDPNPPAPFVGGSLQALDNAFRWAQSYNLKVIVDLHAAPGSQNGNDHSGSRDGSQEWGKTDDNIAQTVQVIEFLAARYGSHPSLLAVELINEPTAPGVTLDSLTKYYQAGYAAVRRHTSAAYVIMSNRLSISDDTELLQFASGFQGSVVDVHYYNLYTSMFKSMTAQQNIDYIYNNRANQLGTLTSRANGPPIFVGEWTGEWNVQGGSKEDYQRFAQAQIDVYGRSTFGWSYWSLKNEQAVHWSLEWMINNGYISL